MSKSVSGNDTLTRKKREEIITGGVSVAERARLFGTQVKLSSSKNQQSKPNININRRPQKDLSTPQKNNHRSPTRVNTRIIHEQPSPTNSHNYSTRSIPRSPDYHNFQQTFDKANYTQIVPSEIYPIDDYPFLELNGRQQSPSYQTSNYSQSIHDFSERYPQQQISIPAHNDLHLFDIGNLINRIQQDYVDKVRPYVSGVEFVEDNGEYDRNLAKIGLFTPATIRRGYTSHGDDVYHRRIPSNHYDYIDRNHLDSYEKMHRKRVNRRKHRPRYHDQASSPIHILSSSHKMNTRRQSDNPPVAPIPKLPTPVATSSSEEEEEEATIASSQPAQRISSDVQSVTSSESSTVSEDNVQENASTAKPVDEVIGALVTTETKIPSGPIRPALQYQTPSTAVRFQTKKSETEESETEESQSDSDSDSDDDDDKSEPLAIARPNQRATSGTPNTRSANSPHISTNQPPESTNSIHSFDPEDSGKSSRFTGKLKSILKKFRRKKSYEM